MNNISSILYKYTLLGGKAGLNKMLLMVNFVFWAIVLDLHCIIRVKLTLSII